MRQGANRRLALVALGLLAGAALLWLSPEDRTLGIRTKLVYLHGALIVASLLLYAAAAALALVFLWRRDDRLFRAATGTWLMAVATNGVSFPTGLYAAKVIWGGFFWSEPRIMANAGMLVISLLVAGVALISANRRGVAATYAVAATLFGLIIRQAGRVMHPVNPIGSSDSWAIKLSFLALLLLILALTLEAVRSLSQPERKA